MIEKDKQPTIKFYQSINQTLNEINTESFR